MHYSVCLNTVYPNMPAADALNRVRAAGFSHYEFWGWWDRDLDALLAAQQATGMQPVTFCTRMIPLTDPARRDDYIAGLRETAAVCKRLGCRTVITQVGSELPGVPREAQHASIVAGLKACLPILREHSLTLVFEPLNTRVNHHDYYLWQSQEAFDIADEVGDEHVKVLLDLYHQAMMDDLDLDNILRHLDSIGHIHIAGTPNRQEPQDCALDYPGMLASIRQAGYAGAVGLEYKPARDADEGLRELHALLCNA